MDERPNLLAVIVERGEHTQEEICARYGKCAQDNNEDAALSMRTLRRWIVGDVRTRPRPAQCRVARLYWGYPIDQLLAPAPPDFFGASCGDLPTVPAATTAVTLELVPAPNVGEQRELGDLLNLERQVAMSARRAARFTTFAETNNIGPEAADQLRDDVTRLANDYVRDPLVSIIGELVETQDSVFAVLEGKQKPTLTKDLFVLASIMSGLLSKASHDLGQAHDAMTQARTMYVCADNAGHVGLRAWARGLQSLIAYWAGRPQEAARYAAAGAEIAENLTGSVTAWLPALHARALAQLPEPRQARHAIGHALDRRGQIRPDDLDEIGGLLVFSPAKQHYYAAGAYVFLGDADTDAEGEAQTALHLYDQGTTEQWSFSDEAGARAELALARVHGGQLDGAREPLAAVLDLAPERRIGGIVTSANRVHQALREPRYAGSPVAQELRDEIEAFCQVPAAALPA